MIVTGAPAASVPTSCRPSPRRAAALGFVDRLVDAGRALAGRLPGTVFEACDVTDVPALQAAIARLLEHLDGADVLVNNVANDERHHLEELTPAYFDQRISAVNLRPHSLPRRR
mgnify:CR=1 FL=1